MRSGPTSATYAGGTEQGCQICHFMANFEIFGHFSALAMKKRIWPFSEIWPFLRFVTVKIGFY